MLLESCEWKTMLVENIKTGEVLTLKPGQQSTTFWNNESDPTADIPTLNLTSRNLTVSKTTPVNSQIADLMKEMHTVKKVSVSDYEVSHRMSLSVCLGDIKARVQR